MRPVCYTHVCDSCGSQQHDSAATSITAMRSRLTDVIAMPESCVCGHPQINTWQVEDYLTVQLHTSLSPVAGGRWAVNYFCPYCLTASPWTERQDDAVFCTYCDTALFLWGKEAIAIYLLRATLAAHGALQNLDAQAQTKLDSITVSGCGTCRDMYIAVPSEVSRIAELVCRCPRTLEDLAIMQTIDEMVGSLGFWYCEYCSIRSSSGGQCDACARNKRYVPLTINDAEYPPSPRQLRLPDLHKYCACEDEEQLLATTLIDTRYIALCEETDVCSGCAGAEWIPSVLAHIFAEPSVPMTATASDIFYNYCYHCDQVSDWTAIRCQNCDREISEWTRDAIYLLFRWIYRCPTGDDWLYQHRCDCGVTYVTTDDTAASCAFCDYALAGTHAVQSLGWGERISRMYCQQCGTIFSSNVVNAAELTCSYCEPFRHGVITRRNLNELRLFGSNTWVSGEKAVTALKTRGVTRARYCTTCHIVFTDFHVMCAHVNTAAVQMWDIDGIIAWQTEAARLAKLETDGDLDYYLYCPCRDTYFDASHNDTEDCPNCRNVIAAWSVAAIQYWRTAWRATTQVTSHEDLDLIRRYCITCDEEHVMTREQDTTTCPRRGCGNVNVYLVQRAQVAGFHRWLYNDCLRDACSRCGVALTPGTALDYRHTCGACGETVQPMSLRALKASMLQATNEPYYAATVSDTPTHVGVDRGRAIGPRISNEEERARAAAQVHERAQVLLAAMDAAYMAGDVLPLLDPFSLIQVPADVDADAVLHHITTMIGADSIYARAGLMLHVALDMTDGASWDPFTGYITAKMVEPSCEGTENPSPGNTLLVEYSPIAITNHPDQEQDQTQVRVPPGASLVPGELHVDLQVLARTVEDMELPTPTVEVVFSTHSSLFITFTYEGNLNLVLAIHTAPVARPEGPVGALDVFGGLAGGIDFCANAATWTAATQRPRIAAGATREGREIEL